VLGGAIDRSPTVPLGHSEKAVVQVPQTWKGLRKWHAVVKKSEGSGYRLKKGERQPALTENVLGKSAPLQPGQSGLKN